MNVRLNYRAHIDGLRAIAVLSVVAYHAFPESLPGGFVGVDVFFVISGYLISSILFESLHRQRFDLREFYARRIRRIFPALLVVLIATALSCHFIAFSNEIRETGAEMFAGAAFLSNILFLSQGGRYFDADWKPLLHLWSLGIEEQFYILWPLLIWLLHRRPRSLLPALIGLLAISFAFSVVWSYGSPNHAFFSPLSRFWELLVGAVLAHLVVHSEGSFSVESRPTLANVSAGLGLVLIGLAAALFDRDDPFPGWRGALPTLGAALLIAAGSRAFINQYILSTKSVVFIGLISYPLYLWHWPLLSMLQQHLGSVSAGGRVAAVALSMLLAWLTFKYVERPIRVGLMPSMGTARLAAMMTVVGALGLLMRADAFPIDISARGRFVRHFENAQPEYRYIRENGLDRLYRLECDYYDFFSKKQRSSISPSCFATTAKRSVLLWGDSHAQSLSHGLQLSLPPGVSVLQVATSGCRPSVHELFPDPFGVCNRSNRFALDVVRRVHPDIVVLAQAREHEKTDWSEVALALRSIGARQVLLVGPLPQWNSDLHKIVARKFWDRRPTMIGVDLRVETLTTDRKLRERYDDRPELAFISLVEHLCDLHGCLAYVRHGGIEDMITFDYGHLTRLGSEFVGREILGPAIERLSIPREEGG